VSAPKTRKHLSLSVRLRAALYALGLDPDDIQWDHSPPLALRERSLDGKYIPDECDPRYLVPMSRQAHKLKTHGGTAHKADGDIHKIAKAKRLMALILKEKVGGDNIVKFKPKIPSRPFQKKPKN